MTVLVLSILVILAYALSFSAGVYARTADNVRDSLRRECAMESALNQALAMLRTHTGTFDSLDESWAAGDLAVEVGPEKCFVSIVDENRKLNVNLAARPPADGKQDPDLRDALERLVVLAGGGSQDFESICAWIDAGRLGAHDEQAPKQPLAMIGALRAIPELNPKLFVEDFNKPRLDALLCTHAARINVNTARREVLDALWDDPELVRQVTARREREPFQNDADVARFVQTLPPAVGREKLARLLSAQSDCFTVTVTPVDGPGESLAALVRRTEGSVEVLYVVRVKEVVQ